MRGTHCCVSSLHSMHWCDIAIIGTAVQRSADRGAAFVHSTYYSLFGVTHQPPVTHRTQTAQG